MNFINKLKEKILRRLYSTSDKTLLNADWNKFRWGINGKKIIIWGLTSDTEKYLNVYNKKIEFIVDSTSKKRDTEFNGFPVKPINAITEYSPNSVAFIILCDEDKAVRCLNRLGYKFYYSPFVIGKNKKLLHAYRRLKNIKKPFISIKKGLVKLFGLFKKIIKNIILLPYKLIFDKLLSAEDQLAVKTLSYKSGSQFSKNAAWNDFMTAQKNKRVVCFGYSRAFESFCSKYGNECVIDRCYSFNSKFYNKELMGVPIKSLSDFTFNSGNEILLISSTYYLDARAYMSFAEEQGIYNYFSIPSMNSKSLKFKLLKPAYLLRRACGILRKKNGIFRNFIIFPVKGFLRICHIPPFYKPYKGLEQYKNKFKGKRCFIVATGPSLCIEDVERLKNEFTFGVNTIFKMFNKTTWRPTFYCMCDPNFYNNYCKSYKLDFGSFCVEKAFITDYIKKKIKHLNQKFIQLVPVNYLDHFCKGQHYSYKYTKNILYGHYNAQTVVNFCINLADYMGFAEIYLLGTDCSYSISQAYFDGSKNIQVTSVQMATLIQSSMIEGYNFIKNKTQNSGLKIFNATRGGKLEVFPRVDFDTLFPYENMEYDYTLMPDGSRNPITVSVLVLTYCHEKYVRKTLDSILMQETKFKIEIIIGDDCSKDKTQEILRKYNRKYPGRFTMILRGKNIGVTNNAYDLSQRANGKYVAYLEGDDYWSDPLKLQKQVDFLEYHKDEYIACTTALDTIDEFDNITHIDQYWDCRKTLFTYKDIDGFGMPSLNNTMVHKNVFLNPKADYSILCLHKFIGDQTTLTFLASQGAIFRMPEKTTCYRRLSAPTLKSATSMVFRDPMLPFDWCSLFYALEKFVYKNFKKRIVYKAKNKMIYNAISTIQKYKSKKYFKAFFKLFMRSSNKFEFIAVSLKAAIKGIINESKKHAGKKNIMKIKQSKKENLLINSNFSSMASMPAKTSIETREPIPGWLYIKLPGEVLSVSLNNGLHMNASMGDVRLRQKVGKHDLSGRWVTLSAYVVKSKDSICKFHIFDEKGSVINSAEFISPAPKTVIYFAAKIPKNCKHPFFQLIVKSLKPVKVDYIRLEYGKKPTAPKIEQKKRKKQNNIVK